MRPFSVKLWGCIVLLAGFAIVIGCGSGNDILDQTGTQYSAYAVPQDADTDTSEIDVWSHLCTTDYEGLTPFSVKIVITTSSYAADLYVESYDVFFRPNEGTYCEEMAGTTCEWEDLTDEEMPDLSGTVLTVRSFNYSSPVIEADTTATLDGLLVWTQGDKLFYGNTVLNTEPMTETITDAGGISTGYTERQTADLTYDFQVVLHCRTVENLEVTITTPWSPVHFADFDNC